MEPQTPLALPPEHRNNRKFIIIIASLFLLFMVSASLMFFDKDQLGYNPEVIQNQKSNNDIEWKTYRNEEYGFEFKYPKDLEVKELENDKKIKRWEVGRQGDDSNTWYMFDFGIYDTKDLSLLDFVKGYFDAEDIIKIENLYDGLYVNFKGMPGDAYFQMLPGGKRLLFFNSRVDIKSKEFSDILSTFKLIESSTAENINLQG